MIELLGNEGAKQRQQMPSGPTRATQNRALRTVDRAFDQINRSWWSKCSRRGGCPRLTTDSRSKTVEPAGVVFNDSGRIVTSAKSVAGCSTTTRSTGRNRQVPLHSIRHVGLCRVAVSLHGGAVLAEWQPQLPSQLSANVADAF